MSQKFRHDNEIPWILVGICKFKSNEVKNFHYLSFTYDNTSYLTCRELNIFKRMRFQKYGSWKLKESVLQQFRLLLQDQRNIFFEFYDVILNMMENICLWSRVSQIHKMNVWHKDYRALTKWVYLNFKDHRDSLFQGSNSRKKRKTAHSW